MLIQKTNDITILNYSTEFRLGCAPTVGFQIFTGDTTPEKRTSINWEHDISSVKCNRFASTLFPSIPDAFYGL